MAHASVKWLPSVSVMFLLALCITHAYGFRKNGKNIKSSVFMSPKLELGPGSVVNEFFFNIDFPKGHFGLKGFDADVVDELGNPVPVHETYIHHWIIMPYYARIGLNATEIDHHLNNKEGTNFASARNNGICQKEVLGQYYGLGSDFRKTSTRVPDPYAIEVGNPEKIPDGYEVKWFMNVHAIDTRGVEDRVGCTECRCNLYNVTVDEHGQPLSKDYKGGLECCYGKTQCRVRQGMEGIRKRNLYVRYTVRWARWDKSLLPVKIYIFDVTDSWSWRRSNDSAALTIEHNCKTEYDVESCKTNPCVDAKRTSLVMPFSGYVVYGVAHQHSGGIGSTLYRQDGEKICSSIPTYGKGDQPGDEAGYIVGMSTCYPKPGSVKITNGETLVLESNYSSVKSHTGVMGLFKIMVADELPKSKRQGRRIRRLKREERNRNKHMLKRSYAN